MSRPVPTLLGALALVAACNDGAAPPGVATGAPTGAPTARPGLTQLRDPLGTVVAEARLDGARCGVRVEQVTMQVVRDGGATTASPGLAGTALRLEPAANGDQITADGSRTARIFRDPARPGHTDVLDTDGVAMARIAIDGNAATIVDAARAVSARLRREGGRVVIEDADGRATGYASGDDLELAALLYAPAVPPDLRGLAACDRLLPPAVAPAGTP